VSGFEGRRLFGGRPAPRRLRALTGAPAPDRRVAALLTRRANPTLWLSVLVAGALGGALAGPIAALVVGVYCGLVVHLVQRREQRAQGDATESVLLDAVVSVAADLRAGQPAESGYARIRAVSGGIARKGSATPLVDLVERRVQATIQLAEASGAPLADLLDRLEADVRARRAVAQHGAAQAAGATATGWLLTLLPFAGVGLGYVLGVDPARQLLHTPLGAGCVAAALVLQLGGLLWVSRIARMATELGG